MAGRPYTVAVPRVKTVVLMTATTAALAMPSMTLVLLEKLVGLWCWALLLRRAALAMLGEVYHVIQEARGSKMVKLSADARAELEALVALAPWLETNLETPWLQQVFATDASMEGYGVCQTRATMSEIRAEARFAESKGWVVCMNDEHDIIEEACWSEGTDQRHEDTFELQRAQPDVEKPLASRTFRVAHLFSGHRREGDVE